jgi:hypothetical protein
MRNVPGTLPAADDLDSARLILRDRTTAIVRPAGPRDTALLVRFFHDLSRDALLRMSGLAEQVPELEELDLNPVIALPPAPAVG